MKKLFLCLLTWPGWIFTQNSIDYGRNDQNILQEELIVDIAALRQFIYEDIPDSLRSSIHNRSCYEFADFSAHSVARILSTGAVYNGWDDATTYINAVLKRVAPSEVLETNPFLKAYLVKDGSHNAAMTPSGHMLINIGFFSQLSTESALAGILAHEIAHYVLKHGAERFVRARRGEFKPGFLFKNEGAASRFSIANELEADSLALTYMRNAGYHSNGLLEAFKTQQLIEKRALMLRPYISATPETTHPSSARRITIFNSLVNDKGLASGQQYLVSKTRFESIKQAAKAEVLSHLMKDFSYHDCLEQAFRFHLFDPYNPTYVYYVLESIRRMCYLNNDLWHEPFLVHRYYEQIKDVGGVDTIKVGFQSHFFKAFIPTPLLLKDDDSSRIEAKFYWQGKPKFITNEEAFQFFLQIGQLIEEPECILSNALSFAAQPDKMKAALQTYLEHDGIDQKEFAQALLSDSIENGLNDGKLTFFSRFFTVIRQGKHEVVLQTEEQTADTEIKQIVRSIIENFPKRSASYLSDIRYSNMNDYISLQALERFSWSYLISKGSQPMLHILDPSYWALFKKYDIKEIEFINCLYRDVVKANGSLEGYQIVAQSKTSTYLAESKKTGRHLNILISSVQMSNAGTMKKRYYDGEDRVGFKKTGYEEFRELLQTKLKNIDEIDK